MRRLFLAAASTAALLLLVAPTAGAANRNALNVYTAVVSGAKLAQLDSQGVDLSVQAQVARGYKIQLILTAAQRNRVAADGVSMKLTRVKGGKTVKQFAAAQAANGFTVWRSWDEPGGIRDQMRDVARSNPQLAKLVTIGDDDPGPRDPRDQADRRARAACRTAAGRRCSTAPPSTRASGSPPRSTAA